MQIDDTGFKNLILWVLQNLQMLETELLAYKAVCLAAKALVSDIDESLEMARASSAVQDPMKQKYDSIRERFVQLLAESRPDQDLLRFLQEWKPEGRPN